ncbi:MAG: polysaccharide deacetylase family protein [Romboutsia sp.]
MKKNQKKSTLLAVGVLVVAVPLLFYGITLKNNTSSIKETKVEIKNKDLPQSDKTLTEMVEDASLEINKGPSEKSEKIAYITIDDGPSKYTNQILDIFKKNNVKATFFMIDGNMKNNPEAIKRMDKEGHSMGFHSVSHDVEKLYKTPQDTLNEFETCNSTLYNITGKTSKLIRLPYGSKPYMPEESYKKLLDNKYLIWDWNLDTLDWKSTTDQIVSNVLYYGREKEEIVLLIHEKEQSVEALESTIKVLRERGYEILPITEKSETKNFWKQNLNK